MPSLLVFTKLWLHYVLQQATNAMRSHSPVEMSACRDDAFMQTPQMIFNSTHIRGLSLFSWKKFGNFWHITRLPTSNCCKVVSSRKQHGFGPTSYVAYNGQYCATPVAFLYSRARTATILPNNCYTTFWLWTAIPGSRIPGFLDWKTGLELLTCSWLQKVIIYNESCSPRDRCLGLETEILRSWSWHIGLGCFRDRSIINI